MKTYVISLLGALERRRTVQEQFCDAGVPFSFFDAFPGDGICLEDHFEGCDRASFRLNTYRDPLPNEIGCFASHRALWKDAAKSGKPVLILEDDCALGKDFPAAVRVTQRLVNTYGFLRLQPLRRTQKPRLSRQPQLVATTEGIEIYYVSDVPLCLVGYALSPGAASRLVSASRILASPVDKLIQRTWEHRVPIFAMNPAPITTSAHANDSCIGNRANKKRDLKSMVQRGLYKAEGELRRFSFDRNQLKKLNKNQIAGTTGRRSTHQTQ